MTHDRPCPHHRVGRMRFFTASPDYEASGTTVTQLVLVCLDCEAVVHHESHDVVEDLRAEPRHRPVQQSALRGAG